MKAEPRGFKIFPYLILAGTLLLVVVLLPGINSRLSELVDDFRTSIFAEITRQTGLVFKYRSMSPSLLREIRIQDIEIYRPDGTLLGRAGSVAIRIDLLKALGEKPLESLGELSVHDWYLDLDLDRDFVSSDTSAATESTTQGPRELFEMLVKNLKPGMGITLSKGSARIRKQGTELSGTMRLVSFSNDSSVLRFDVPELDFSLASAGKPLLGSRVSVGINYGTEGRVLYGTFGIFSASNDFFSLRSQEFSWSWFADRLVLQKTADFSSLDMNLSYFFEEGILKAELRAIEHPLREILTFRGELGKTLGDWQDMPLDLSADLSVDLSGPILGLDYRAELRTRKVIAGLGEVKLQVDFQGDESQASIRELVLENELGHIALAGNVDVSNRSYDMTLQALSTIPGLSEKIATSGRISGNLDGLAYNGQASMGSLSLQKLGLYLNFNESLLSFSAALPDGFEHELVLGGKLAYGGGLRLNASLEARDWRLFNQSAYLDILPGLRPILEGFLDESTVLDCALDLSLNRGILMLNVPEFQLASPQRPKPYLLLRGSGDMGEIRVDTLALDVNGIAVDAQITARLVEGIWALDMGLEAQGQALRLTGEITSDLTRIELSGDRGINISGYRDQDGAFSGQLRFESFPFEVLDHPGRLSAILAYEVPARQSDWNIDLQSVSVVVQGLVPAFPDAYSRLNLAGHIRSDEIDFTSVQYVDTVGGLSGTVHIDNPFDALVSGSIELAGPRKQRDPASPVIQETLSAAFTLDHGSLTGKYRLGDLALKRLGLGGFEGNLAVDGSISGDLASYLLALDFSIDRASLGGAAMEAKGHIVFDQNSLQLDSFSALMLGHQLTGGRVAYRFADQLLEASGTYRGPGARRSDEIQLGANVSLSPQGNFSDSISIKSFPLGQDQKADLLFIGTRSARGWQWNEQSGLVSLMVRSDGRILLSTRSPFPFVGNAEGFVRNGEIDISFSRLEIPLAPLKGYLDLGYIGFTGGNASGELRVKGPLADPSFFGSVKVRDLRAFAGLSPGEIHVDEAYLILEDRTVTIVPVLMELGDGRFELGGYLNLHRLGLSDFSIDIAVDELSGLPVDTAFGIMKVKGRANGKVRVWGAGSRLMVGGNLSVSSAVLSVGEEVRAQGAGTPSPAEPFDIGVDLNLVTGKNVEFIWPSIEFPLLRSFLDREQAVHITFEGLRQELGVSGLVSLRGGEVFYLERSFYIKEAAIRFNEKQGVFNPYLDARAELRTSFNGVPYRMVLTMANTRLLSPQGTVTSDPPLSGDQIALLLSGADPDRAGQVDLGSAIYAGADVVTRLGLGREIENFVRNYLPVDVFSLRTGFFPALVRDAVAPVSGPLDTESYSFGKYFDNTALLLGKFFGDDVYAELLAQVRSDESLVSPGNALGLVPELELNMEWNTPFMDILWSFSPKDTESLYLRDNKFTLMWKF